MYRQIHEGHYTCNYTHAYSVFIMCVQFTVAHLQTKLCRSDPHYINGWKGAVAKFHKASDSFDMPICPSVSIIQLPPRQTDFPEKYLRILLKYAEKFQLWLKSNKHKRHFMRRPDTCDCAGY
jgi:hypothetical protein